MSFTNAQLAQQIADLISFWSTFNEEYKNWLGGEVAGGPSSDGLYPLTDYTGAEDLVACPAKLADNVAGYVGTVAASETAAAASAAAALSSETEATAQAVIATAQAVLADADRVAAELAETGAVDAKVTAIAQAAAAAVSAAAAAADAILTAADVVLTNADVVLTHADVVLTAADVVSTGLDAVATAADAVQTALDLVATNQDTIDTAADLVATNQDTIDTAADLVATNQDTIDTAADAVATAADLVLTDADTIATAADRVQTGLDAAATAADLVQTDIDQGAAAASAAAAAADEALTNADAIATAADRVQTALDLVATNQDTIDTAADLVATNQDTIDTAADLVATNQDTIDTAADLVQTALDAIDTAADVIASAASALAASNSADAAAASAASIDYTWASITSKPTTIAGYGITDLTALIAAHADVINGATAYGWGDHASGGYISATGPTLDDAILESTGFGSATISRDHASSWPAIKYRNNTHVVGYAGFNDDGDFILYDGAVAAIPFEVSATGDVTCLAAYASDTVTTTRMDYAGVYASRVDSYLTNTHGSGVWHFATASVNRLNLNASAAAFTVPVSSTGAVTGSNLNVANWDTAYGWGDHAGLYAPAASPTFTGTITNAGVFTTSAAQHLFNTPYGNIEIGPKNASWGHIYTDRANFYFNKGATFVGNILPSADSLYDLGSTGVRWAEIWGDTFNGAAISDTAGNSTIVKRTSAGYVFANYFNMSSSPTTSTPTDVLVQTGNDNYLRWQSFATFATKFGANAYTQSGLMKFTYASEPAPSALESTLTANFLHIDGKEAIDGSDAWLRLNQNSEFTSGVYTPGKFLVGGELEVSGLLDVNGNITCDGATIISGVETFTIDSTGDITKQSHGNYLFHKSTAYDNDQNGEITFSTSAPSGGTTGDIWFKYTA